MADVREDALVAFEALLAGVAGSPTVLRNSVDPITAAQMPALVMMDGGERPSTARVMGQDEYDMSVDVWLYVTAATAALVGPALSTLRAAVLTAIGADHTLGGAASDVIYLGMETPEPADEAGVPHALAAVMTFEIRFASAEDDPNTAIA